MVLPGVAKEVPWLMTSLRNARAVDERVEAGKYHISVPAVVHTTEW